MKKYLIYIAIFLVVGLILIYFLNEMGVIATLFGGSLIVSNKLKKELDKYEKDKAIIEKELDIIKEKKENLKVKDKSSQEEVDYWKKQ